jgi:hypothetical protein
MTIRFSPIRLRTTDLELIGSRRLSPHEVCQLTQVEDGQAQYIARREFRIDEIVSLYQFEPA